MADEPDEPDEAESDEPEAEKPESFAEAISAAAGGDGAFSSLSVTI